ncbi:MAG: metal-sensing transcriptional repressor [Desulfovibrio sp.]|nr:metal-sensing transcriptional repressor [Desulfovibrio sp.]
MRGCMDVEAVVARLKRIEGQVRGIMNMVQEDVPCEDILVQIGAAKSALHKTGQVILEGHLHHCVLAGIADGDAGNTLRKLAKAIEQFSRMT